MNERSDEFIERVGNAVDVLCSVDVTCQNVIQSLSKAGREKAGGSMTAAAAKLIRRVLNEGDVGIIVTGFPIGPGLNWLLDPECIAETDGPPGAAILARAINRGFDAIPIVVSSTAMAKFCKGSCQGAGFVVTDLERALRSKPSPAFADLCYRFSYRREQSSEVLRRVA